MSASAREIPDADVLEVLLAPDGELMDLDGDPFIEQKYVAQTVREIPAVAYLSSPAVGKVLRQLEAEGYVERARTKKPQWRLESRGRAAVRRLRYPVTDL